MIGAGRDLSRSLQGETTPFSRPSSSAGERRLVTCNREFACRYGLLLALIADETKLTESKLQVPLQHAELEKHCTPAAGSTSIHAGAATTRGASLTRLAGTLTADSILAGAATTLEVKLTHLADRLTAHTIRAGAATTLVVNRTRLANRVTAHTIHSFRGVAEAATTLGVKLTLRAGKPTTYTIRSVIRGLEAFLAASTTAVFVQPAWHVPMLGWRAGADSLRAARFATALASTCAGTTDGATQAVPVPIEVVAHTIPAGAATTLGVKLTRLAGRRTALSTAALAGGCANVATLDATLRSLDKQHADG